MLQKVSNGWKGAGDDTQVNHGIVGEEEIRYHRAHVNHSTTGYGIAVRHVAA